MNLYIIYYFAGSQLCDCRIRASSAQAAVNEFREYNDLIIDHVCVVMRIFDWN